MTEAIEIKLRDIALRPLLSPRNGISQDVVKEYAEHIAELPPILVATDKPETAKEPYNKEYGVYVLIDGWHRYRAHQAVGHDTIMAIVDEDLAAKDFFFRAICANKAHGVRFNAEEKKRISKYLFMSENRSAAEISQAIGCSVRHATELIKSLQHEKKAMAIRIAKNASYAGYSEREIAAQLKSRGFKASKSGVNRWLKPEPQDFTKEIEAINESQQAPPQIGESPKRDTTIDEELRDLVAEVATVVPVLKSEDFEKLYCAKCKKDSKERTGKWYKITVDTVDSSTCFDFMICSFCRRALGRWVRNE